MKRMTLTLWAVLAAACMLFTGYLLWIHKMLDKTGPVITIEEELLELSVSDPEEMLMQGITAWDERDGDVTDSLLVERVYGMTEDNITTVTYAAVDSRGNVSKVDRQVRYVDYESPRFELHGSLNFAAGSGFDLMDYVAASDVLEGDITRRIRATLVSDTRSVNETGRHTVRFQVTNSLGDNTQMELTVEVYDPEWYTATVQLTDYMVYLEQGAQFNAMDYLDSFLVRGDPVNVSGDIPADITCAINGRVNTQAPGVYEVTYTLAKNVNLLTHTGQAKLVVVVLDKEG